MSSFQNSHIFSQGGDLSQLTCGFPSEKDSGTNEEQENNTQESDNIQGSEIQRGQDETMSSRAEAICEENRQINRFVEVSLKHLEKKRIQLINKEKALDEEKEKLLETQKRQSEHNRVLQMNTEEWSIEYANQLKKRNEVEGKLKQVEEFISIFEKNLAKGVAVGESIEESKKFFQLEFDQIQKKSEATQEAMTRMKNEVVAELEKKAQACKELKDAMMTDRETMVDEIQTLAYQNEEALNRMNGIQEEIKRTVQNKEALTQSYNSIFAEHSALNVTIEKNYQELNEAKTINASRIQHLKLQINTEENHNRNLDTKLKEKDISKHNLTLKLKELTNLSNQMKEAVDGTQKRIEKKVKEIDLYKNKESVLNNQACSLVETLTKYENVKNENQCYKDNISLLEEELKLNINILTEKEPILNKLKKEMKEFEEKLDLLKENMSELDKELQNAKIIENKLTSSVKEDKIVHEQERERKIVQNESIKQSITGLASEITECTLKLEELHIFNENAKEKEEKMKELIESCQETVRLNEDKFLKDEEEQIELVEKYNETINELENQLDKYEFFVLEAKPKQKELSMMLEKKASLEEEIKLLTENHQKKMSTLEINHRAKIQGMDDEMEKHSSIMKNIQTAEEESTNKLKVEIKEEEKMKTTLENELRVLQQKLKSLKNEELVKRNKIAKIEKRQQTIMKEIKVTREDIAQAVTGKEQEPQSFKRTRLMTPSSSASSYNSIHGKAGKREEVKENRTILAAPASKQESTRKWIDSVPDDDYEFSEI